MKLLSIETSCDETAVSVLEARAGDAANGEAAHAAGSAAEFRILGNALISQIDIHKEYGGVYPMIAKREHAKNLVPLLDSALAQAGMGSQRDSSHGTLQGTPLSEEQRSELSAILEREPKLFQALVAFLSKAAQPDIDAIAVTAGPGLEPALWVGVNFARALSLVWNVPVIPVNHMEGHICAALAEITERDEASGAPRTLSIPELSPPLLSLLISGGHTELVLSKEWGTYELIGQTRDDAVGEAFDKVARMLGLPYPGGPEISKLAEKVREAGRENDIALPRPMIHDPHCDFSFSGLKTAVLYQVKDRTLSEEEKEDMARAFEDAAADVLYAKTARALEKTGAQTLALGGGVSANTHIQRTFRERLAQDFPYVRLAIPAPVLTTDNALMIGLAGFYHAQMQDFADPATLRADGNRKLRA